MITKPYPALRIVPHTRLLGRYFAASSIRTDECIRRSRFSDRDARCNVGVLQTMQILYSLANTTTPSNRPIMWWNGQIDPSFDVKWDKKNRLPCILTRSQNAIAAIAAIFQYFISKRPLLITRARRGQSAAHVSNGRIPRYVENTCAKTVVSLLVSIRKRFHQYFVADLNFPWQTFYCFLTC